MSWNNRIFRHRHKDGSVTYALHEAHYNSKGEIWGWTEDPVCGHFDTIEDLIGAIELMYKDVSRYKDAVLDYDMQPQGKPDCESEDV